MFRGDGELVHTLISQKKAYAKGIDEYYLKRHYLTFLFVHKSVTKVNICRACYERIKRLRFSG